MDSQASPSSMNRNLHRATINGSVTAADACHAGSELRISMFEAAFNLEVLHVSKQAALSSMPLSRAL
jgi:hypothetical protein